MSQFTNYGENKVADFIRGQGLTLPSNWYLALGTAANDAAITEITTLSLTRGVASRALGTWDSTQGDSLVSSGTTKKIENTNQISCGTSTGSDTATHVGFMDNSSGGNCWVWIELTAPIAIVPGPVSILANAIKLKLGQTGGATYYLVNKMLDLLFRGQAFTWPASLGLAYFTAAPTDAGGGTEASGGGYDRVELIPSLTSICSTQGNTSASSGTGGEISNLAELAHPDPSGDQGDIVETGVCDAMTVGNLLWHKALDDPISIVGGGQAPYYPIGELKFLIA